MNTACTTEISEEESMNIDTATVSTTCTTEISEEETMNIDTATAPVSAPAEGRRMIRLSDISPDAEFAPKAVRQDTVKSLADSFGRDGQLAPVGIIPGEEGSFRLVFGYHRLEAARQLGWESIWAEDVPASTLTKAKAAAAAENSFRNEASPIERIEGIFAYGEAHGISSQKDLAKLFGFSAASVSDMKAIHDKLPEDVKKIAHQRKLGRKVLAQIARLEDPEAQRKALEEAAAKKKKKPVEEKPDPVYEREQVEGALQGCLKELQDSIDLTRSAGGEAFASHWEVLQEIQEAAEGALSPLPESPKPEDAALRLKRMGKAADELGEILQGLPAEEAAGFRSGLEELQAKLSGLLKEPGQPEQVA